MWSKHPQVLPLVRMADGGIPGAIANVTTASHAVIQKQASNGTPSGYISRHFIIC